MGKERRQGGREEGRSADVADAGKTRRRLAEECA